MTIIHRSTCCEWISFVEATIEELRALLVTLAEKIDSLEARFDQGPVHEDPDMYREDTSYDNDYDASDESPQDMS